MVRITAYKSEYRQNLIEFLNAEHSEKKAEYILSDIDGLNCPTEFLVCLDDNQKVLGYVKYTVLPSGIARVDDIYVGKNLRRDKNGSLLLVAVMQKAVNRLIAALICECASDNDGALAFLKAMGFIQNEQKNDIIYLSKSLLYMYKVKPEKK